MGVCALVGACEREGLNGGIWRGCDLVLVGWEMQETGPCGAGLSFGLVRGFSLATASRLRLPAWLERAGCLAELSSY